MAYVSPTTKSTGTLITAAIWNQDIVANEQASAPDVFTTKGDLFVASGADTGARLGVGTNALVLIADSAQTLGVTWGQVDTDGIANDAITAQKIAEDSIDDTMLGANVPQFYRRQGGSTTNWGSAGTTTYTPGSVRMQAGVAYVFMDTGVANASITITFPVAFSQPPLVLVSTFDYDNDADSAINAVKTSGSIASQFTVQCYRSDTANESNFAVSWLAIGPE